MVNTINDDTINELRLKIVELEIKLQKSQDKVKTLRRKNKKLSAFYTENNGLIKKNKSLELQLKVGCEMIKWLQKEISSYREENYIMSIQQDNLHKNLKKILEEIE